MYEVLKRKDFSETTFSLEIRHPQLAKAAQPGQFVIVRLRERGERIPLTLADYDRKRGSVTLVIQAVGKTTREMQSSCHPGTRLAGMAGPLGVPSHIGSVRKVVCVGGGLGVAPIFPQLRAYKQKGAHVIGIVGFRTRSMVFWEDRFREFADELVICTDDGSSGIRGRVTEGLADVLGRHPDVDEVIAIGPPVMMRACAEMTRPQRIRTMVSLNPIMVDGTGMCGGCRVTVGGQMKLGCVDGPDFDGHLVDFDELINRLNRYREDERLAMERWQRHRDHCNLVTQTVGGAL